MQQVFRPTPADLVAMEIESLYRHAILISGRGAAWIDREYVDFWRVQETQGPFFGDKGFTRFERHKGLITEVYEFIRN